MYLLFMTCTPVFAGPKEDALGAYHWFFELFTTDNHDQIAIHNSHIEARQRIELLFCFE